MLENLETIKINGIEYEIQVLEELSGDIVGDIDFIDGIIRLEKHSKRGMLMTLLHESIHGILFSAGLNNTEEDEHDERLISALAHGFYTLIKDNPKLVKKIQEGGGL